jgi:hypothetical protein
MRVSSIASVENGWACQFRYDKTVLFGVSKSQSFGTNSAGKFKGSRVNFCYKIVTQAIFGRSAKETGVISLLK